MNFPNNACRSTSRSTASRRSNAQAPCAFRRRPANCRMASPSSTGAMRRLGAYPRCRARPHRHQDGLDNGWSARRSVEAETEPARDRGDLGPDGQQYRPPDGRDRSAARRPRNRDAVVGRRCEALSVPGVAYADRDERRARRPLCGFVQYRLASAIPFPRKSRSARFPPCLYRARSDARTVRPPCRDRGRYVCAVRSRTHSHGKDCDLAMKWSGLSRRTRAGLLSALGAVCLLLIADRLFPPDMTRAETLSTEIVDRHGTLLRPFLSCDGYWRLKTNVTDVSPRYLMLLKAYEDKRFESHPGVDPLALGRAVTQLVRSRHIVSGASTLTMQVARLL